MYQTKFAEVSSWIFPLLILALLIGFCVIKRFCPAAPPDPEVPGANTITLR